MRWKEALVLCTLAVVISLVVVCASQLQAWLAPRASSPPPDSPVVDPLQPSPALRRTAPSGEAEVPATPLTSLGASGDTERVPDVTASAPAAEPVARASVTEPPDPEPQQTSPDTATPAPAETETTAPSPAPPSAEATTANEASRQSPAPPRASRSTEAQGAGSGAATPGGLGSAVASAVTARPRVDAPVERTPPAPPPGEVAGPEALPSVGGPSPTSAPRAAAPQPAPGQAASAGPVSQPEKNTATSPVQPAPGANATPPASPEIAPQGGGTTVGAVQDVEPGSPDGPGGGPELEPQARAVPPSAPQEVAPAAPTSPITRGRELTTLLYEGQLSPLWDALLPSARARWSGFAAFQADLNGREAAYGPESRLLGEAVNEEDGGAVYTRTVTFQGGGAEPWAVTFHLDENGDVRDFQIRPAGTSP